MIITNNPSLLPKALEVFKKGEKRVVEKSGRKFYLFWYNGLCISLKRISCKKYPISLIRKRIERDDLILFCDEIVEEIPEVDGEFYFFRSNRLVYVGKEKPFSLYDMGRIPYEFFRRNVWTVSIKGKFIDRIMCGVKSFEIRKEIPKGLKKGDFVFVYRVGKGFQGYFEILEIKKEKVRKIWRDYKDLIGISQKEFKRYFGRYEYGYLIGIKKFYKFGEIKRIEGLKVPSNFYLISEIPGTIERLLR